MKLPDGCLASPRGFTECLPPGQGASPEGDERPAGILVFHGMGQQIRFETIDTLARALRAAAGGEPPVACAIVNLGDQQLGRASLRLPDGTPAMREVHIYEAYWAPETQGQVSLVETTAFLWDGAWRGIRHCLTRDGGRLGFQRWLFGGLQHFEVRPLQILTQLLAAAGVLSALLLLNTVIAGVAAARATTARPTSWPTNAMLADLTVDLCLAGIPLLVAAALLAGTARVRERAALRCRAPQRSAARAI